MFRRAVPSLLAVVLLAAPGAAQLPSAQASVKLRMIALPSSSPLDAVAASRADRATAADQTTRTFARPAGAERVLRLDADVARRGTLALDPRSAAALARAGLELRLRDADGRDVPLVPGSPIALTSLVAFGSGEHASSAMMAYRIAALSRVGSGPSPAEGDEVTLRFEVTVQVGERPVRWRIEVTEAVPTPERASVGTLQQH